MESYLHQGWSFRLADAFPLQSALEKTRDAAGHFFYEKDYEEDGWETVTLPHTFNDCDLFRGRIEDAGGGQKRTFALYRKWVTLPGFSGKHHDASPSPSGNSPAVSLANDRKVFLEFEGVRQTCYLYVNGRMAGYYEAGAAPFGFDLTPYLDPHGTNLLAVATDNTSARNIPFCAAETPNCPGVQPGSYLCPQDEDVPPEQAGVGFQWNCNDFNPSVGGLTRPVKLHVKPSVYLTLPLYSNLMTRGVYVYGTDYDLARKTVRVAVEAEVRNESLRDVRGSLMVRIRELDGTLIHFFPSEEYTVKAGGPAPSVLSVVPRDAYAAETLPDGKIHYVPVPSDGDERNVGCEGIARDEGTAGDEGTARDEGTVGDEGTTGDEGAFGNKGTTRDVETTGDEGTTGNVETARRSGGAAVTDTSCLPESPERNSSAPFLNPNPIPSCVMRAESAPLPLRLWDIEDPYLYRVEVILRVGKMKSGSTTMENRNATAEVGNATVENDSATVETGKAAVVTDSVTVETDSATAETDSATAEANITTAENDSTAVETDIAIMETDRVTVETGFRHVAYDKDSGLRLNGRRVWLTGYAQRSSNEWAAIGIAPEWLKDMDAMLIKESGANHIRWMHVAASPADIRSMDRHGIICTQPAGDKESETFGRQWQQRLELMRDVIIAFRNHPSILFWEAGNNSINREHMRQMRLLKEELDPRGGRFMGCRTINTEDVLAESEYVGTMLNRHAARFLAEHGPVTETEYSREEAPRRSWDDYTPPDYGFRGRYIGKGGKKQKGLDYYNLTMEGLMLAEARGYSEFFHDRIGGASGKNYYSACAALCWTDSAQHGRQSFSENARMSGRVDPLRIRKQNFYLYQVMQSETPRVHILGHWNYPDDLPENYRYPLTRFNGQYWEETGRTAHRDPSDKTVYVAGSYPVARVDLLINGEPAGTCSKPIHGFLFPFPHIAITRRGRITAIGYDYAGKEAARHTLRTAGAPARLRLTLHTSPAGFLADGADLCYADVEILDENGLLCPLCDWKITFRTEGEAVFLGGYNSGRFTGYGRQDSVIRQNHVYAECGCNRVFFRSTRRAGNVSVYAETCADTEWDTEQNVRRGAGLNTDQNAGWNTDQNAGWDARRNLSASLSFQSRPVPLGDAHVLPPVVWYEDYTKQPPVLHDFFPAIPQADRIKYEPDDPLSCKILVNGQEPDTLGVRSLNKNGSIWGAVLCILERMAGEWDGAFTYAYDKKAARLTVQSGGICAVAQAGHTHLLVNGEENLMDGEPYVTPEGIFVMEVNAIVPYIRETSCQYDEKIGVLRIERRRGNAEPGA